MAQQTRELTLAAAGLVDAGVAEYADGRLTWSRFDTLVAAKVIEADPTAAAERERAAAEEEFAKVGRSNDHGQKTLYVRSTAAAIARMDATIDYLARALAALGDTDTLDQRRAKALLVMANPVQAIQLLQAFAAQRASQDDKTDGKTDAPDPDTFDDSDHPDHLHDLDDQTGPGDDGDDDGDDADGGGTRAPVTRPTPFRPHGVGPDSRFSCGFDPRRLLPAVVLYLHLYARSDTGEVGPLTRWEGEAPVTTEYLREVLGPACAFTINRSSTRPAWHRSTPA